MGNWKTGAIERFPVLRSYHTEFAARLSEYNSKLMVIGYSFQDEHINNVIERASRQHGLGTYLVDLRGREVLLDHKMANAAIKVKRLRADVRGGDGGIREELAAGVVSHASDQETTSPFRRGRSYRKYDESRFSSN